MQYWQQSILFLLSVWTYQGNKILNENISILKVLPRTKRCMEQKLRRMFWLTAVLWNLQFEFFKGHSRMKENITSQGATSTEWTDDHKIRFLPVVRSFLCWTRNAGLGQSRLDFIQANWTENSRKYNQVLLNFHWPYFTLQVTMFESTLFIKEQDLSSWCSLCLIQNKASEVKKNV